MSLGVGIFFDGCFALVSDSLLLHCLACVALQLLVLVWLLVLLNFSFVVFVCCYYCVVLVLAVLYWSRKCHL